MKQFFIILVLGFLLPNCIGHQSKPWVPMDLQQYGIPATILAPADSTQIENFDLAG